MSISTRYSAPAPSHASDHVASRRENGNRRKGSGMPRGERGGHGLERSFDRDVAGHVKAPTQAPDRQAR